MTRWFIEKSGTGIEKSGTGIEKSGTGIEKSGTGIEKSGTGIEKSGTGIRKSMLACSLAAVTFASVANANSVNPNGELQLVSENGVLTASWSIDGAIFAGVASVNDSFAKVSLTELSLRVPTSVDVVGGGTGAEVVGGGTGLQVVGGGTGTEVVGGGTGVQVVGGGTGSKSKVVGGGTGSQVVGGGTGTQVVGGGTGTQVVGGGTGTQVVGGGTGLHVVGGGTGAEVVGGGTGANTLVVGGGTGIEAVAITINGGFQMEVSLGCGSATVSVLDAQGYEVVTFDNVKVKGSASQCVDFSGFGGGRDFDTAPIAKNRLN